MRTWPCARSSSHPRPGVNYYIQVGGHDNETGPIDLTIQRVTPLANDARSNAAVINTLPFQRLASNINATPQRGEAISGCSDTEFLQSVWFRYTATSTDSLRVTIGGDDGTSALVAIFTGSNFSNDVEVACLVVGSTDFIPASGITYYFLVAGQDGRSGRCSSTWR